MNAPPGRARLVIVGATGMVGESLRGVAARGSIDHHRSCDVAGRGNRRTDLGAGDLANITHRSQARAQWLEQDALRRQNLYKEFIEAAARCFVHSLQHEEADIPGLIELYAKIDRMRILSSAKVVEIAERFARKIVDTYSEPNKSFLELRAMINSNSVSLMREFSTACREELTTLRTV